MTRFRNPNFTKFQTTQILAAIDAGASYHQLAALHHSTYNAIGKLARRHGRKIRPVNGVPRALRTEIKFSTEPTRVLAERHNLSPRTINRIREGAFRVPRHGLTQQQIAEIRAKAPLVKNLALAFEYGVSESTIKRIAGPKRNRLSRVMLQPPTSQEEHP